MGHLAGHPVANFIISRAVSQLDRESFGPAIEEVKPKLIDCIDNYRTGFFKALVERSASFDEISIHQEVIQTILKAFGIEAESEYRWIFPCMISLMRMDYFRKTTMFNLLDSNSEITQDQVRLPDSNVQGSVLLQSILHTLPRPLEKILTEGLAALPIEIIIAFSRDPIGSRALDAVLKSPSITSATRRHFTMRFLGKYHELADDRIGSHIAETIWAISDVYLKEKIAFSLLGHQVFLQKSSCGHFFLKKLDLPLFERQREAWKSKMVIRFPKISFPPVAKPSSTTNGHLKTSTEPGLGCSKESASNGKDNLEEATPLTSKKETSEKKEESSRKRPRLSSKKSKPSLQENTVIAANDEPKSAEKKKRTRKTEGAEGDDSTEVGSKRKTKLKKDRGHDRPDQEGRSPDDSVLVSPAKPMIESVVKKKSKKRKAEKGPPPIASFDTSILDQLFQPLESLPSLPSKS